MTISSFLKRPLFLVAAAFLVIPATSNGQTLTRTDTLALLESLAHQITTRIPGRLRIDYASSRKVRAASEVRNADSILIRLVKATNAAETGPITKGDMDCNRSQPGDPMCALRGLNGGVGIGKIEISGDTASIPMVIIEQRKSTDHGASLESGRMIFYRNGETWVFVRWSLEWIT